jgi:hypothetical protein
METIQNQKSENGIVIYSHKIKEMPEWRYSPKLFAELLLAFKEYLEKAPNTNCILPHQRFINFLKDGGCRGFRYSDSAAIQYVSYFTIRLGMGKGKTSPDSKKYCFVSPAMKVECLKLIDKILGIRECRNLKEPARQNNHSVPNVTESFNNQNSIDRFIRAITILETERDFLFNRALELELFIGLVEKNLQPEGKFSPSQDTSTILQAEKELLLQRALHTENAIKELRDFE